MKSNKRVMLSVVVFGLLSSIFIIVSIGLKQSKNSQTYENFVPDTAITVVKEEITDEPAYEEEPVILVRSSTRTKGNESEVEEYDPDLIKITVNGEEVYIYPDENVVFEDEVLTVTADELVKWAFKAYYEGWEYVYAGCEEGYVDCSGLIKSKVEVCARGTEELLAESALSGPIETIPEIPGLGVYYQGHVGIYVGDGMVIDARTEASGIGYDPVEYEHWTNWFEIKGVDYSRYTNDGNE